MVTSYVLLINVGKRLVLVLLWNNQHKKFIVLLPRPEDTRGTRPIPWLLVCWLFASPSPQWPWYWLCKINVSLPSTAISRTTFRYIFTNENICILIRISLKFVPMGPIDNTWALVHVMGWRRIRQAIARTSADPVQWHTHTSQSFRFPNLFCKKKWNSIVNFVNISSYKIKSLEEVSVLRNVLLLPNGSKSSLVRVIMARCQISDDRALPYYNMVGSALFLQRALYTVHCTNTMHSRKPSFAITPPFLVNTVNRYFVTYAAMKYATFYWNNFIWLPVI